jgi:hypothetical protein
VRTGQVLRVLPKSTMAFSTVEIKKSFGEYEVVLKKFIDIFIVGIVHIVL